MKLETYQPRPHWIRYLLGYLALFLGGLFTRTRVLGRHHIPAQGPYIIACNHFSLADPALVVFALRRPIQFLMASDMQVEWHWSWAPRLYGFIPTNRTRLAPSTIKRALKVLNQGQLLGIFPEGTSQAEYLRAARPGIVYLAALSRAPILPVGISGAEYIWEQWFAGLKPRITVAIGRPFGPLSLPAAGRHNRRAAMSAGGDEIICRLAALLPDRSHGDFRGDLRILSHQTANGFIVE